MDDLQPAPCGEQPAEIDDVDAARAQEYALLAMLLARAPDAAALGRIAKLSRRCDAAWSRACGSGTSGGQRERRQDPARVFQSLHWYRARRALPYGSYYLTGFLQRAAAGAIARGSARARHRTRRRTAGSPRITPPSSARSWPVWSAADFSDRGRGCNSNFSKSISLPGSGASSPIWNEPMRPTSIAMWEQSVGCSWRLKQKHSRCRRERARGKPRRTRR